MTRKYYDEWMDVITRYRKEENVLYIPTWWGLNRKTNHNYIGLSLSAQSK